MAAKKKTSRTRAPTKSDFIREKLKAGMSASDIVKAAAEKGTKISPPLIYKLKTKMASGGKKAAKKGKTGPKKGGKLSASDFIRKHPNKSANEIVALGKKAKIKFGANLVYTVRQYDRKKTGAPKGKLGRKSKDFKFHVFPGGARSSAVEEQFKQLLRAIGIDRAKALIDEVASWGKFFGVMK
jgi:hypothetical protein